MDGVKNKINLQTIEKKKKKNCFLLLILPNN